MSIDLERVKSIVEALIFVSEEPVPMAKIRKVLENAIGKGEVVRDEKNRTYALAA